MQETRSYGSVGVPAGNRRHYPEDAEAIFKSHAVHKVRPPRRISGGAAYLAIPNARSEVRLFAGYVLGGSLHVSCLVDPADQEGLATR